MLIDEVRAQLDRQLANADAHDNKAIALIGADLAGAAVLVGVHDRLNRWWFMLTVGGLIAFMALSFTVFLTREFAHGVDVAKFYKRHIADELITAQVALLAALNFAYSQNRKMIGRKTWGWRVGAAALAATAVAGICYLPVVH